MNKDQEISTLIQLLDKLKIYDIQLSYDESGILQARDEDGNIDKSYEDLVDVKKEPEKACLYRLVEFGLTPEQVTAKEFPIRAKKENVKKTKEIMDSEASLKTWECLSRFDKKGETCNVIKAQIFENNLINLFYSNNYFTQIKVSYSYL